MKAKINKDALIILGRYPKTGSVKSRLGKEIGEEKAAKFYRLCLEHILTQVDPLRKYLTIFFLHPSLDDQKSLESWLGRKFFILPPKSEDIEENLDQALEFVFGQGFKKVVTIATDVPDLTSEIILDTYSALEKYDIALGSDNDDAIYIYGAKENHPEFFELEKGKSIFNQVLDKSKNMSLKSALLPKLIDIDNLSDLMLFFQLKGNEKFKQTLKTVLNFN